MSLLLIGLICWIAMVAAVLGLLRAAALADRAAKHHASELGLKVAAPVPDEDAMRQPGRTRLRAAVPARTPGLAWAAAVVTLAAAAITAGRLGGAVAVAMLAIGAGGCGSALAAVVVARRRGAVIDRQAQALAMQRNAMVSLALRLLEVGDPIAAQHAAAVAHHARVLAGAAGLPEREQQIAHAAGLLHDIGLQRLADRGDAGARQPGPLDRPAIRAHPLRGASLLRPLAGFQAIAAVVAAHHERIDGTGYPHGLRGDHIPRVARIVAIAEVYDVLTSPTAYRSGHGHESAAQELRRVTGTQLDARLVEIFLTVISPPTPRPSLDDELRVAQRMAARLPARAGSG